MNRGFAWILSATLALSWVGLLNGCVDAVPGGDSFIDNLNGGSDEDSPDGNMDDAGNDGEDDDPLEASTDSDGDGFADDEEINGIPGSDPQNPDDTPLNPIDTDGDGCSDFDELNFDGFCDNDPNTGAEEDMDDDPGQDDPDMQDPDGNDPPDDPDDGETFTFQLTVSRHVDTAITDEEVDAVFAAGSTLLQEVDTPCDDVATNTTFARNGTITTFEEGGSTLTAETQLNAVFDVAQDVKVVEMMIGVCGVPQTDDMSIILGCAFTGGSLVVIADADPDVWVHEWGHVQGLLHRDSCESNIMHSFEAFTNAVNASERIAFLSPSPSFGKLAGTKSVTKSANVESLRRVSNEPLADWLHRLAEKNYIAGVPSAIAREVGVNASLALEGMLLAPGAGTRPRNVARMLGFTRDPAPCGSLIDSTTSPIGDIGFRELSTIAESFLALGRLSADDASGEVLAWLMEGADPDVWSIRGVNWTHGQLTPSQTHDFLARMSIMALSVSGQTAALDFLETMTANGASSSAIRAQLDEAIIRLKGLSPPRRPGSSLDANTLTDGSSDPEC